MFNHLRAVELGPKKNTEKKNFGSRVNTARLVLKLSAARLFSPPLSLSGFLLSAETSEQHYHTDDSVITESAS